MKKCKKENKYIYPNINDIFAVFKICPLANIKVVILGQDCYINHMTENNIIIPQAIGLSFSVPVEFPFPLLSNTLKKVFKFHDDLKFELYKDCPRATRNAIIEHLAYLSSVSTERL